MNQDNHVTIKLTHSLDEDSEFREITEVDVEIFFDTKKVGCISAMIVDRKRIPKRFFYSSFDGHSATLQWIGCALMEPMCGRTKLKSLAEFDDPKFDWMLIKTFHVDDEYKKDSSDTATTALRLFLHHPFISGNIHFGSWKVSSVAYELDPTEAMGRDELQQYKEYGERQSKLRYDQMVGKTVRGLDALEEEKRRWEARLDDLARIDAIPFLRNGFFQDAAIASGGGTDSRIIVASHGHFREPLISHQQAAAIQFCPPVEPPRKPTGKDGELFEYSMKKFSGWDYIKSKPTAGAIRQEIQAFVDSGASVARSHALHVACRNNALEGVEALLDIEPSAINGFDSCRCTPLMLAAVSAAGRANINGISETRVIDLLLARGVDRGLQDRSGMTAYGHYVDQRDNFNISSRAMSGRPVIASEPCALSGTPSEQAVQIKLTPPNGPSPADLTGGKHEGIIDYRQEDMENNAEIDFDDSYGDY